MKTYLKIGFIFLLVLTFYFEGNAQFILNGEIRPRLEVRNGYATFATEYDKPAVFFTQRSRLNVDYKNDHFRTYISLQDVRTWGDEDQVVDVPSTALHEGWGELFFNKLLSLKMGRQELAYEDYRLLGNVDWVQQARSHDAAVLKFNKNGWRADAGGAFNNLRENDFKTAYLLNNYRVLLFGYANKTFKEKLTVSLLHITDGFEEVDSLSDTINYRHTFGPILTYKSGKLELNGSFFYQFGNLSDKDIRAFMATFSAQYKVNKLTLRAAVDIVSGTNALNTLNKENNSFSTLYATNHKFYGFMDYFTNLPLHTANGGLIDPYLRLNYKFSEKINAYADYHYFMLENNVADLMKPSVAINKELGSEIDAVLNYNIFPLVNLQAGYSMMFGTSSLETLKKRQKGGHQYWGWTMLTFKPEFFHSEKYKVKQ